tara:strand:+ start:754 stop:957 length:204 start_codon:yes stop_codon:yes gene_type:complete
MKLRPIKDILTEAIIIGIMNVALFYAISGVSNKISTPIAVLIAGMSIHILFEYTGGNQWWCTQTYKL